MEGAMASTPEVKVKARVRAILDALGIYYFMPPANGYGRQGIPDIICCMAGRFVAIECKAGKGQLTELQKRELDKIMNADGLTFVAREDNLIELKELLNEHRNV
jgi:Holliday junction resolvase